MVLFGIFKRKKKTNQTPANTNTNPTVTSHPGTSHHVESKYTDTTTTAKQAETHLGHPNTAATNLASDHLKEPHHTERGQIKQVKAADPDVTQKTVALLLIFYFFFDRSGSLKLSYSI